MKRFLFTTILCVALVFSLFAAGGIRSEATAESNDESVIIESGTWETAGWILTEDYQLIIFGYGEISGSWAGRDQITSVSFVNQIPDQVRNSWREQLWPDMTEAEFNAFIANIENHPGFGLTNVPHNAFDNCTGITSVTLPESLTTIGNYAFNNCTSLPSLTLPDHVTNVSNLAFGGYSGRLYVTIGSDTAYALSNASSSYYFCVDGNDDVKMRYVSETVNGQENTVLKAAAYDSDSISSSVTVPAGVQTIENSGFSSCAQLESVELPEGLTTIEGNAFAYCRALNSVSLPETLTTIKNSVFYECTSLSSIELPAGITSVDNSGYGAFPSGTRLYATVGSETSKALSRSNYYFYQSDNEKVRMQYVKVNNSLLTDRLAAKAHNNEITGDAVIPEGVTEIANSGFTGCTALTDVHMSDTVTSIEGNAFNGCTSLAGVFLSANLTTIKNYAFSGCTGLTSLALPDSITAIDPSAFSNTNSRLFATIGSDTAKTLSSQNLYFYVDDYENVKLQHIITAGEITGLKAAAANTGIASAVIPTGVTQIANSGFSGCSNLRRAELPEALTSIESSAFYNCTHLAEINLPNELESIGMHAFEGCGDLLSLTLPDDVTSLYNNSFTSSTRLYATVESATAKALSRLNMYFHVADNENVKLKYTYSNGDISGLEAYADSTDITAAEIPEGVTKIANNGFSGCASVAEVSLPVSLRTIGAYAFNGCTSLGTVRIPASVTSIDASAFPKSHEKLIVADDSAAETWVLNNGYPLDTGAGTGNYCYSLVTTIGITQDNFPDPYFLGYVIRFDLDTDGALSEEERNAVTKINPGDYEGWEDQPTHSLIGIEYFPMLEELVCTYSNLERLDLSLNTHLKYLNCSYNPLYYLNLSNNTELTFLDCRIGNLSSLDVSHMPNLAWMDCSINKLYSLTIGSKATLQYLSCGENRLTSLDVSRATCIDRLHCSKNHLTSLNLGQSTILQYLTANENKLTELNIADTPNLTFLACEQNQLTALDISQCHALESIMVPEYLSYNPKWGHFIYFKGSGADNWFSCDTDVELTVAGLPKYANPTVTIQNSYTYPSIVTFTVESAATASGEVYIVTGTKSIHEVDPWVYIDDWYEENPLPATFRAGGEYPIYLEPGKYMVRTLQVGEGYMDTFSYYEFEVANSFTFSPEKPNNQEPFELILDTTYDRVEVQVYQQGSEEPYLDAPIVVNSTDRVELSLNETGWYTIKVTCEKNGIQTGPIENRVEVVQWRPIPDLILPADLISIDAEAFYGIRNVVILIPDSVRYIAENAFDPSVIVVADLGSYAYNRCDELGIAVYDDDY